MRMPTFATALATARLATLALLTACAAAPDTSDTGATPAPATDPLADYPPLPAGPLPGASPAARQFAASLGRGVNFGNMLDAPTEGARNPTCPRHSGSQPIGGYRSHESI